MPTSQMTLIAWGQLPYALAALLLLSGTFGRTAMVTWPIAALILIVSGHWMVGALPIGVLAANLANLALARRRAHTDPT